MKASADKFIKSNVKQPSQGNNAIKEIVKMRNDIVTAIGVLAKALISDRSKPKEEPANAKMFLEISKNMERLLIEIKNRPKSFNFDVKYYQDGKIDTVLVKPNKQ